MSLPGDAERITALLDWLDRLPAKEFPAILEQWDHNQLCRQRGGERMFILSAWTQADPEAAASWAAAQTESGLGQVAFMWALRDSQAASLWIKGNAPKALLDDAKDGVMKGMVESSPDLGRSHWAGLDEDDRERFGETVEKPLLAHGFDFAAKWLADFPDEESRDFLSSGLAASLTRLDPAKTAEWSASIEGQTAREAAQAKIAGAWMAADPTKAREWVAALPPGSGRMAAIGAVAVESGYRDSKETGQWLESLGGGEELDQARASIVRGKEEMDPAAALKYASQVVGADDRTSLQQSVVQGWWKKDEKAATAWIAAHPGELDESLIRRVTETATSSQNNQELRR